MEADGDFRGDRFPPWRSGNRRQPLPPDSRFHSRQGGAGAVPSDANRIMPRGLPESGTERFPQGPYSMHRMSRDSSPARSMSPPRRNDRPEPPGPAGSKPPISLEFPVLGPVPILELPVPDFPAAAPIRGPARSGAASPTGSDRTQLLSKSEMQRSPPDGARTTSRGPSPTMMDLPVDRNAPSRSSVALGAGPNVSVGRERAGHSRSRFSIGAPPGPEDMSWRSQRDRPVERQIADIRSSGPDLLEVQRQRPLSSSPPNSGPVIHADRMRLLSRSEPETDVAAQSRSRIPLRMPSRGSLPGSSYPPREDSGPSSRSAPAAEHKPSDAYGPRAVRRSRFDIPPRSPPEERMPVDRSQQPRSSLPVGPGPTVHTERMRLLSSTHPAELGTGDAVRARSRFDIRPPSLAPEQPVQSSPSAATLRVSVGPSSPSSSAKDSEPRRIGFGEGLAKFIRKVESPKADQNPDESAQAPDAGPSSADDQRPEDMDVPMADETTSTPVKLHPATESAPSSTPAVDTPSQASLLERIQKLDDDIAEIEDAIARQKEVLEGRPDTSAPLSDDTESHGASLVTSADEKAVVDRIYAENARLSKLSSHQLAKVLPGWLTQACPPGAFYTPLYREPLECDLVRSTVKGHVASRPRLLRAVREKKLAAANLSRLTALEWWTKYRDWKVYLFESRNLNVPPFRYHMSAEIKAYYAARLAPIPNMLTDEEKRYRSFRSRNALVEDPRHAENQRKLVNPWLDAEREIFEKKYAKHPKNFAKIAKYLPNKSVGDCVAHYYSSKTVVNYKSLVKKYRKMVLSRKGIESNDDIDFDVANMVNEDAPRRSSSAFPREILKLAEDISRNNIEVQASRSRAQRRRTEDDEVAASGAVKPKGKKPSTSIDDEQAAKAQSTGKKRSRVSGSASWDAREKELFVEALSLHGKDFGAIGEYVQSKDAEKCKNFFNNNKTKMLFDKILAEREARLDSEKPAVATTTQEDGNASSASVNESEGGGDGSDGQSVEDAAGQVKVTQPRRNVNWTSEEKTALMEALRVHGRDWKALCSAVPTRTETQIKNFYQNYKEKLGLAAIATQASGHGDVPSAKRPRTLVADSPAFAMPDAVPQSVGSAPSIVPLSEHAVVHTALHPHSIVAPAGQRAGGAIGAVPSYGQYPNPAMPPIAFGPMAPMMSPLPYHDILRSLGSALPPNTVVYPPSAFPSYPLPPHLVVPHPSPMVTNPVVPPILASQFVNSSMRTATFQPIVLGPVPTLPVPMPIGPAADERDSHPPTGQSTLGGFVPTADSHSIIQVDETADDRMDIAEVAATAEQVVSAETTYDEAVPPAVLDHSGSPAHHADGEQPGAPVDDDGSAVPGSGPDVATPDSN
ncbi:unnamed protein product (mitochondrion) [Plasmodiophora brassicae]|uniref:SANT domain-containing protein n=2 Tax=Plasmodiophora brassicae TaxID=37360 RepID=A0A3P3YIQ0_PLABS|nr:unnamed protein product [Plasmodiophora brassicae]